MAVLEVKFYGADLSNGPRARRRKKMTVVAMTETPNAEAPKKSMMQSLTTEKLTGLIVVLFAAFGAFLNFVGICIQQSNYNRIPRAAVIGGFGVANSFVDNVYDEQWFHTFYYIAVLVAFCVLSMMSTFSEHRMTLMAFLSIGFVYLTNDMHGYIVSARGESGLSSTSTFTRGGPATSFTGCFFMVLAWFYMMVYTGGIPSMPSCSK